RPAEPASGPALRRVHGADPRARRAPVDERRAGRGPAVAARTRRPPLQHLRARLLGELDGSPLKAPPTEPAYCAGSVSMPPSTASLNPPRFRTELYPRSL